MVISGGNSGARKGDAFPQRTVDLLKRVNAAMFGAITSKPVKAAETELVPELRGKGLDLPFADRPHAPVVRSVHLSPPVQGVRAAILSI